MRHRTAFVTEILSVLLLGMMAGFFFAFAADVAPAMVNLDAAGYITTQQWINKVVRNAVFGGVYFGSALLPFVTAALVAWGGERRRGLCWLAIAVGYFASVFWVTRAVNVPINDALATWTPSAPSANWQAARDTWNQSNLVRTVAAAVCFLGSVVLVAMSKRSSSKT